MNEMVERVARAIFVAADDAHNTWPTPAHPECVKMARAAIAAMREPNAQVGRERDEARADNAGWARECKLTDADRVSETRARQAAERQLAEARAALAEVKILVCGDRAPHWQDDYRVTITRDHIADVCDGALLSGETT